MKLKSAIITNDHEHLAKLIEAERTAGKKVVLTNGAFDLLHVGHIRYLNAASEEGDVLVVALNGDASIRRTKGEGRPLVPLVERMEVVGSLRCVDYVTSFDADTVDRLLEQLRPHVHAKGTDWTPENLPETPTLRRLGIRFAVVGDPKNHSSSALRQRIQSREA